MSNYDEASIKKAVEFLNAGKVIGFPTETVYGIGCDAANPLAVRQLYLMKNRSSDKPLQIMVKNAGVAKNVAALSPIAQKLAATFWPGPLTMVVAKRHDSDLAPEITKTNTIGIRVPNHPAIQQILNVFGRPMATTSANFSGKSEALTATEVEAMFEDEVGMVIDGGPATLGIASTVVDVASGDLKILRKGTISEVELIACLLNKNK